MKTFFPGWAKPHQVGVAPLKMVLLDKTRKKVKVSMGGPFVDAKFAPRRLRRK